MTGVTDDWQTFRATLVPNAADPQARRGRGVYASELNPDGTPPKCPALEAKGFRLVRSFERVKDFPAVHLYE